jgi:hypothetical protein
MDLSAGLSLKVPSWFGIWALNLFMTTPSMYELCRMPAAVSIVLPRRYDSATKGSNNAYLPMKGRAARMRATLMQAPISSQPPMLSWSRKNCNKC